MPRQRATRCTHRVVRRVRSSCLSHGLGWAVDIFSRCDDVIASGRSARESTSTTEEKKSKSFYCCLVWRKRIRVAEFTPSSAGLWPRFARYRFALLIRAMRRTERDRLIGPITHTHKHITCYQFSSHKTRIELITHNSCFTGTGSIICCVILLGEHRTQPPHHICGVWAAVAVVSASDYNVYDSNGTPSKRECGGVLCLRAFICVK